MILVFYGGSLVEQAGMATTYGFHARYGTSTGVAPPVTPPATTTGGGGGVAPRFSFYRDGVLTGLDDDEAAAIATVIAVKWWTDA